MIRGVSGDKDTGEKAVGGAGRAKGDQHFHSCLLYTSDAADE